MRYINNKDFSKVKEAYTFDDLLLKPTYSEIKSRKNTDISQNIFEINLETPIIPANMSSICESKMVTSFCQMGGTAAIHRFLSPEDYIKEYMNLSLDCQDRVGICLGLNEDWNKKVLDSLVKNDNCFWPKYMIIDVAHGHHDLVGKTIYNIRNNYKEFFPHKDHEVNIVVGNICSEEAVDYFTYLEKRSPNSYRIHGYKVGIGPGSLCTTRQVTGCGYPQLSAIKEVAYKNSLTPKPKIIIADGGIKNSGDIVKAIAAGAHLVMIGSLFAGTEETPSFEEIEGDKIVLKKKYFGMASKKANEIFNRRKVDAPEGVESDAEKKGSVKEIINTLNWGLRSGLSYCGCNNLEELREYGDIIENWIKITNAGHKEGTPHFKG